MSFKVNFNEKELTDYLTVTEGFDRGILPEKEDFSLKRGRSRGKTYKGNSIGIKQIPMPFVLKSDLIEKRRALAAILNVKEPKELWFSDEPEKVWYAVPTGDIGIEEKNFLGFGTITWIIYDGVAFAKNESIEELPEDSQQLTINYDGSEFTFPKIEVEMQSDNGYIAFINQNGKILQFGNPQEIDGYNYEQSEYGIIDYCKENFSDKNYESNGWKTNQGNILQTFGTCTQIGNLAYGEYKVDYGTWKGQVFPNFHPSSYGSGDEWHGPSMTRAFTPDSEGSDAADNFKFDITQYFITGLAHQIGMQQWLVNTPEGENVAGYVFIKNSTANQVTIHFVIGGKSVYSFSTYAGIDGRWSGWSWGKWRIEKFDDRFVFTTPSGIWNFTDSIAGKLKAKYTTFYAAQYGLKPTVTIQFMRRIQFVKHNVEKWEDIPNRFGKLDKLEIDTAKGGNGVFLNGVLTPALGAKGNDWAGMALQPNEENEWMVYYSDFAIKPDVKIKYKEAYV